MNPGPFSPRAILILLASLTLILAGFACNISLSEPRSYEAPAAAPEEPQAAPEYTAEANLLVTPTLSFQLVPYVLVPPPRLQPVINESRRLTLEFPPQIRLGEGDIIRLTLEVDELGNLTPTAEFAGNTVTGETVEIPNLYETHNVIAEARLDLAGVEVKPSDVISEPLMEGQSVTFYWSIRPQEAGVYRGTVWLYLRFVDKSNGEESRKTVSAQIVEIEATHLLGLPLGMVRGAGAVGSIVGGVLGFPFLEDIVKFLFRRRMK